MIENKPLVSVLIPLYNNEKHIHNCLNSIINQLYQNLEIICINDASTDNTQTILDYFTKKDKRIKVYQNQHKQGKNKTRNKAITKSRGQYIQFIEPQDWIDKNTIKQGIEKATKYNLDILIYKIINYNNKPKFYKTNNYEMERIIDNQIIKNKQLTSEQLFDIPINPVNKLYNKKLIIENNITFPEEYNNINSTFHFQTILNAKKIMITNEYHYNKKNIPQKTSQSLIKIPEIATQILNTFKKQGQYQKHKQQLIQYITKTIISHYYETTMEEKEGYFNKMKQSFHEYLNIHNLKKDFLKTLNEEYIQYIKLTQTSNYKQFNEQIQKNKQLKQDYKITVIIPLYNAKTKEIKRAFKSIKNQSIGFKNIEIILIDDNSTYKEGTQYIQKLNDLYSNVKIILLNKNKGPGNARNKGIEKAKSKYVMFLDHDDYYLENACKSLYDTIIQEQVDMVIGNYINKTRDGTKVNWEKIGLPLEKITIKSYKENINILISDPAIWSKIYKKEFLTKTNTYFQNFKSGEDLTFFQETCFKAKGITTINEAIVMYKIREDYIPQLNSISQNNSKEILNDLIDSYYYSYNLYKKYYPQKKQNALKVLNYWTNSRLLNSNLSYDDFKEVIQKANTLFQKLAKNPELILRNHELINNIANNNYKKAYNQYQNFKNTQI